MLMTKKSTKPKVKRKRKKKSRIYFYTHANTIIRYNDDNVIKNKFTRNIYYSFLMVN